MSNNRELDGHTFGIVKTMPFQFPAKKRPEFLQPVVQKSLDEFNRNSMHLVRVPRLSSPVEYTAPHVTEMLCRKAFEIAQNVIIHRPQMVNIPFTIIDGTPWGDSVPSKKPGLDIVYINVFWQDCSPVIAVCIGSRRIVKNSKVFRTEEEKNRYSIIFEWVMHETEEESSARMLKAITNSTNYHLLKSFGTCIAKAISKTCDIGTEYPVAAAVYLDDVIWYADRPYRHPHIVHAVEYLKAKNIGKPRDPNDPTAREVQGFITNHGNFVTRYRAMYQALKYRMILDAEELTLKIGPSSVKQRFENEIETKMGGILKPEDSLKDGYQIAMTGLFTEDVW